MVAGVVSVYTVVFLIADARVCGKVQ
jgi:hypothetical protein